MSTASLAETRPTTPLRANDAGLGRALLGLPLFLKVLVANCAVVLVGVGLGTWFTLTFVASPSGDAIDRAFERVQRLQRQPEDDGVDQHAPGEANDEHDRHRGPVHAAAVRAGNERQCVPRAQPNADQHDNAVGDQNLQEER